jgi:uncharacterized repeat protein (TIGR01451 family)
MTNIALRDVGDDAGIFGIVADSNSGIITITPLDDVVPAISVEVVNGSFSAPSFTSVKGRFIAKYSANNGQTFSKQFNKDASSYFLSMDKSSGTADLTVSQTSIPDRIAVESDLTYFVTVKNNGPDSATEVLLTDAIPDGVTFVSATSSQGICTFSMHVVTCALNTLANGSSIMVAIVVTPTLPGSMKNVSEVAGNVPDPDMVNNSAVLTSEVIASIPPVIESIGVLISAVGDLEDAGIFNQGRGNALISILEAAISRISEGKAVAAINELRAFIQHLSAFARAGILPQQQAEALITMASYVIDELGSSEYLNEC